MIRIRPFCSATKMRASPGGDWMSTGRSSPSTAEQAPRSGGIRRSDRSLASASASPSASRSPSPSASRFAFAFATGTAAAAAAVARRDRERRSQNPRHGHRSPAHQAESASAALPASGLAATLAPPLRKCAAISAGRARRRRCRRARTIALGGTQPGTLTETFASPDEVQRVPPLRGSAVGFVGGQRDMPTPRAIGFPRRVDDRQPGRSTLGRFLHPLPLAAGVPRRSRGLEKRLGAKRRGADRRRSRERPLRVLPSHHRGPDGGSCRATANISSPTITCGAGRTRIPTLRVASWDRIT